MQPFNSAMDQRLWSTWFCSSSPNNALSKNPKSVTRKLSTGTALQKSTVDTHKAGVQIGLLDATSAWFRIVSLMAKTCRDYESLGQLVIGFTAWTGANLEICIAVAGRVKVYSHWSRRHLVNFTATILRKLVDITSGTRGKSHARALKSSSISLKRPAAFQTEQTKTSHT